MCPKDGVDSLLHLFDIGVGAGVEGILYDRLLRTARQTERLAQRRVGAQCGEVVRSIDVVVQKVAPETRLAFSSSVSRATAG